MNKTKLLFITLLFLLISIIPYIFTIKIYKNQKRPYDTIPLDGRTIISSDNNNITYTDYNHYIILMAAKNLSAFPIDEWIDQEEFIKLNIIIASTFLKNQYPDKTYIDDSILNQYILQETELKKLWQDSYDNCIEAISRSYNAVHNQIIYYNDTAIFPYYHHISSGKTRISPQQEPYLMVADTTRDLEYPGFLRVNTYTNEDFIDIINRALGSQVLSNKLSLRLQLQINKKDDAGYVLELLLKDKSVTGDQFASIFSLESSAFSIIYSDNQIKIATKGIGHGYGLSLSYALRMSKEGNTYLDIINYFYKNVEIK